VSQAGLEYARALREVKYRETVVSLLMRQYEVARVDEARQGAQAQVVDAALFPTVPHRCSESGLCWERCWCLCRWRWLLALATEAVEVLRTLRRRAGSWPLALEEAWGGGAR
jgi:hypothetical protein